MGLCASAPKSRTNPERNQFQNHQKSNLFSYNQTNPPSTNSPQKFSGQVPPQTTTSPGGGGAGGGGGGGATPSFSEFSFADLKTATNNFSTDLIVSESGEKAPNLVYKGRLKNRRWIAVKKFSKLAWPDPKQFAVIHRISFIFMKFNSI